MGVRLSLDPSLKLLMSAEAAPPEKTSEAEAAAPEKTSPEVVKGWVEGAVFRDGWSSEKTAEKTNNLDDLMGQFWYGIATNQDNEMGVFWEVNIWDEGNSGATGKTFKNHTLTIDHENAATPFKRGDTTLDAYWEGTVPTPGEFTLQPSMGMCWGYMGIPGMTFAPQFISWPEKDESGALRKDQFWAYYME